MSAAGLKKASYVLAKLDKSPLPEFAENTTYIDFSESWEGPTGSGLLKLLYGLRGQPLPDAAVHLAAEVDEETSDSAIKIRAARDVGNRDRLLALAKTDNLAWSSSPVSTCEVAEALIALSDNQDALGVLEPLSATFPKARTTQAITRTGARQTKTMARSSNNLL